MSKKSILRSKESATTVAAAAIAGPANFRSLEELYEGSSTDDEDNNVTQDAVNADDARKKSRIPWDRDPRGDKNGLKIVLLTAIQESRFHVEGRYMDNFRAISNILSQPGTVFERYQGIEPSGAQRKFNQIIKEVAKTFEINENGEFCHENEAMGFEVLALDMIKDIVEKEKEKQIHRQNRMIKGSAHTSPSKGNIGPQGTTLLRKRKAEIVPLKTALRRAAMLDSHDGTQPAPEEEEGDSTVRVDFATHKAVLAELRQAHPAIKTVEDFFNAADISSSGKATFSSTTHVKLDKPVDRIMRLYEELFGERDYVVKTKQLLGLNAADALELESFLRPLYEAHLGSA